MELSEQSFQGKKKVNYILMKADWDCPELLIIFSAFSKITDKIKHPYNYLYAYESMNIHRLFIQDSCGPRGCYYLCDGMDFSVEETVVSLIDSICEKLCITKDNIITVGSSKGGTAALYYAYKYHYGYTIVGVPQTSIVSYMQKYHVFDTLEYMIGESWSENKKAMKLLDQMVLDQIDKHVDTKTYLFLSENDQLWETDFVPLLKKLKQYKIPYEMVNETKMKSHADTGKYIVPYLVHWVQEIVLQQKSRIPSILYQEDGFYLINAKEQALVIENGNGQKVERMVASDRELVEVGDNRIMIVSSWEEHVIYQDILYNGIFSNDDIKCIEHKIEVKYGQLHCSLVIESEVNAVMAFYLHQNGVIVRKDAYRKEGKFVAQVEPGNEYRLTSFVKYPNHDPIIAASPAIRC